MLPNKIADAKTRKPLFVECGKCGERWKIATLPLEVSQIPRTTQCPNCAESKRVFILHTDGPDAVTEARSGQEVAP